MEQTTAKTLFVVRRFLRIWGPPVLAIAPPVFAIAPGRVCDCWLGLLHFVPLYILSSNTFGGRLLRGELVLKVVLGGAFWGHLCLHFVSLAVFSFDPFLDPNLRGELVLGLLPVWGIAPGLCFSLLSLRLSSSWRPLTVMPRCPGK